MIGSVVVKESFNQGVYRDVVFGEAEFVAGNLDLRVSQGQFGNLFGGSDVPADASSLDSDIHVPDSSALINSGHN